MNANVSKTTTGKLLVAVLAMAMVIAGIAIVLSDENVNATATIGSDSYKSFTDAVGAIPEDGSETAIYLTSDETVTGTVDLKEATVYTNGYTLTINSSNTTISNGNIVGDNVYVDLIISGSSLTNIEVRDITFSNPGYFSIDIRSSTVTVDNCVFEGPASASIYLEQEASNVTVTNCDFNGTYKEGAISFNNYNNYGNKVTVKSDTPSEISFGSALGNLTIGGDNANIDIGDNITITNVYLDVNDRYSGNEASKLTVAKEGVSVINVIGNGSVSVLDGASFTAYQSDVPVQTTGTGTAAVQNTHRGPFRDIRGRNHRRNCL